MKPGGARSRGVGSSSAGVGAGKAATGAIRRAASLPGRPIDQKSSVAVAASAVPPIRAAAIAAKSALGKTRGMDRPRRLDRVGARNVR
ncbi:hypothetical protein GCM10008174_18030 [Methylopila turkensis]|uniref:Uncharacterized protein n=1 Tax=Methylopila turkensis TaxID=1437816 RepID=A0A9W6JMZ0_9HYPH|nr:hypothetical protein GCM10008174_18030 [Methylopila turkensis]